MNLDKPTNLKILSVIKKFKLGEVYGHKYGFEVKGALDSESTIFYMENERIFSYLIASNKIDKINSHHQFVLTDQGEIIKKSLNLFSRIEAVISDYPYLLGSLIGGILGGLLLQGIVALVQYFTSN